jgi:two-component system, LytTR family, response regulator
MADVDLSQRKYSCLIVDDNRIDRLMTISLVRSYSFLTITGDFESAETALKKTGSALPDVLFLDVDMPEMNGLDLRAHLNRVPACIFITAFPDYALSAFEVNALDFLIKPLNPERFSRSMQRLRFFLDNWQRADLLSHSLEDDGLFIKEGRDQVKIHLRDIIYLEALKDYTGVITRERKYCVLNTLGNMLQERPFRNFIRIHRSYAVHNMHIQKFNSRELTAGEFNLPVGRIYKDSLNDFLNL